jgi:glycosyltransferase involved in cell wall biosynthesis
VYASIREETGWQVYIIIPKGWKDEFGNTLNDLSAAGVDEVIPLPVLANGNIILHAYRARVIRLLKQLEPDLIYMNHEPYAVATAQFCLANIRSVRVPFGFYSCQNINKKYRAPFSFAERLVYRNSSFALPITQDVSDVLTSKRFHGDRIVCPLPLDPEKYHPRLRSNAPAVFRQDGETVFGFVGRLMEAKGLRTLATALAKLRELPWKLLVVGTGEFQGELEQLFSSANVRSRVSFVGYVPHEQTPAWLAAMDVLILPSETQPNWKEQFGRVIPEALACGTAVIGSDSGEIPNLIKQSGGGLVFQEKNPEALAQALRVMITEPNRREKWACAGREWVTVNVSINAVAKQMVNAFQAAIGRSKSKKFSENSIKY